MGLSLKNAVPRERLIHQCLTDSLGEWHTQYIHDLVESDQVPEEFLDRICDQLVAHPSLASITKEEFLEAISETRPDCEAILRSPKGDGWIDHVLREIPLGLPGGLLRRVGKFFGR